MALMGLDIGTTGCKCTIFDTEGDISSYAYCEYDAVSPQPGYYELNPETVWESVKLVIIKSIGNSAAGQVNAISVSSIGEAVVPIDRRGRTLANSILYVDPRGTDQARRVEAQVGAGNIMKLTGLRSNGMYSLGKIMWIRENEPEIFKQVWKFLLFEDFILFKLGGICVTDYSLASRTMAFNPFTGNWEDKILDAAKINRDVFSNARQSGTVAGTVSPSVADELGLPKDCVLATGGHDQICAALGGGIIEDGLAINSIGTVDCVTPCFTRIPRLSAMMKGNYAVVPHAVSGMYATYAYNLTGGAILKWFRDNFAPAEKAESEYTGKSAYAVLDDKSPRIPTGLLVLPHFAGSGTPHMDPYAKGAILGLTLNTDRMSVYRAILEGTAYEMLYNIECLETAGIRIDSLRAVGGGARSDLWLQIKSDVTGREVRSLKIDEAATLGNMILAGMAIGEFKSINEAVKRFVKIKKHYYPDSMNHDAYMEIYGKYKKLYKAVKDVYK